MGQHVCEVCRRVKHPYRENAIREWMEIDIRTGRRRMARDFILAAALAVAIFWVTS